MESGLCSMEGLVIMNASFWKHKRVFITGHTGFKGSWMSLLLDSMGAKVKGFALEPNTSPSLFNLLDLHRKIESEVGDIANLEALTNSLGEFKPEIVIHMAAQPLVRASYVDPVGTYKTNVMGTINLLEAIRLCETVISVINVTTDKCYENKEWIWGYRETDALGGFDPYSSSKGCSELVTSAYRNSFFKKDSKVCIASARAGNVIGGGDWAEDRLIPDAIRAFENRRPVVIRNPKATRPWQHVLEPIAGYLNLAEKLYVNGQEFAESWNFGPKDDDVVSVEYVLNYLVKNWYEKNSWELDCNEQPHEARLLKLDISKSLAGLDWNPIWTLDKTLTSIIEWHRAFSDGENVTQITLQQIEEYENSMRSKNE